MREIDIKECGGNFIKMIGEDWMLVTAGTENGYNTMTASWGGTGEIWGKDAAFILIRPQRYTYEFAEKNRRITLSFFGGEYKKELGICGSKSGREVDKACLTGLRPVFEEDYTYFEQASVVLVCRKMAYLDIDPAGFLDESIAEWYAAEDYHRMYIAEIEKCLVK